MNRTIDKAIHTRMRLVMAVIVLGAAFLVACSQGEVMTPEQINQVEQGLCANDTHCDFYTDATFTVQCGVRDMCINCSSVNSASGCVTPFRQCFIMAQCSAPPPQDQ
jgi:hypothetical protein